MYKTIKTYLKELTEFRNLRFECIRAAESLEKDMAVLQREYDDFSDRQSKFESDYSRILTNSIPLVIGVAGNFNAGKSSFINSLIGADLLGIKEVPATCKVAVISYHDHPLPKFYRVQRDGRMVETNREEYLRYGLHNKGGSDTATAEAISHFEIRYRAEILKEIQLVDTPGFSTLSKADDQTAETQLRKTDMLIWVFNADKGSHDNVEFDRMRSLGNKKILAVINRMDDVFPGDRQKVIDTIAKAHSFIRVIPYSATEVLAHQQSGQGNEVDVFAGYHRDLITEIKRLRQEISEIKEDAFRRDLMTFSEKEMYFWNEFEKSLVKRIGGLQGELNEFTAMILKLNEQLKTRSGIHCKRLKDEITVLVFNALCYFDHEPGTWITEDKNFLKMRGLQNDRLQNELWDLIGGQFGIFKTSLVKDFHKGLAGCDVEVPKGPETAMMDVLQNNFRASSFNAIVGLKHMYVPFDLGVTHEEMKKITLVGIDRVIASDQFATMTLYGLQMIYDRLIADKGKFMKERWAILNELSKKIIAVINK